MRKRSLREIPQPLLEIAHFAARSAGETPSRIGVYRPAMARHANCITFRTAEVKP